VLHASSALVALLRSDRLEEAVLKPIALQNAPHLRDVNLEGRAALLLNHRENQRDQGATRLDQLCHRLQNRKEHQKDVGFTWWIVGFLKRRLCTYLTPLLPSGWLNGAVEGVVVGKVEGAEGGRGALVKEVTLSHTGAP